MRDARFFWSIVIATRRAIVKAAAPQAKAPSTSYLLTAISMFEDSLQIVMDRGWFDMASLVAIARCNHQMYALVDHADHLWKPFLTAIKFPQTGLIDDTDWRSPDIPSLYRSL
jgi:hypothetical protein